MRITKTAVENLARNHTDQWIWDSELPGFGVRCNPYGRKTYVLRFRSNTGKQGKRTLARCCDMAPEQARGLARKLILEIRVAGHLPQNRSSVTMAELWERYLREHANPYKKPSSVLRDTGLWERHIAPEIATKPIRELTRADVIAIHIKMSNIATSANRAVAIISKMFNLAGTWELVDGGFNPARRIKKYRERTRDRILTESEISKILKELELEVPSFQLLIRLLMITGCRFSEIGKARSEWVDLDRGLLLLPDSKTGQRSVRLPKSAVKLLKGVQEREFICPGNWNIGGAAYAAHKWRRVCRRAGVKGANLHSIRHTVGSFAHRAGLSQREIADMLGHKQLSTTARYIHSVDPADIDRVNRSMGL